MHTMEPFIIRVAGVHEDEGEGGKSVEVPRQLDSSPSRLALFTRRFIVLRLDIHWHLFNCLVLSPYRSEQTFSHQLAARRSVHEDRRYELFRSSSCLLINL
jgi:hypothetical protein